MADFEAGERLWIERLGNLRNVVRQELVARQLAERVPDGSSVLDVGCGQGTQAIRLARRGCVVTGIDPSPTLLQRLGTDARAAGVRIETHPGRLEDLPAALGRRAFQVVCAHGLLMYLDDPREALARLVGHLEPGGLLSVTFRNAAALAFRPGMRREWRAALAAFEATTYVNELGVAAQAHTLEQLSAWVAELGLGVEGWYGVRVFTDPAHVDEPVDRHDLAALLDAEEQAGRRDPYRQLAAQIHLLCR